MEVPVHVYAGSVAGTFRRIYHSPLTQRGAPEVDDGALHTHLETIPSNGTILMRTRQSGRMEFLKLIHQESIVQ